MGLVRRLAAAISRLLETHFPTLFHAASTLSAPSGHLPRIEKAKRERLPAYRHSERWEESEGRRSFESHTGHESKNLGTNCQ